MILLNKDFVYIYTDSNKFPSNKSEEDILNSSTGYILKKTGSKPIINPSENIAPLKNNPTMERPLLLFK